MCDDGGGGDGDYFSMETTDSHIDCSSKYFIYLLYNIQFQHSSHISKLKIIEKNVNLSRLIHKSHDIMYYFVLQQFQKHQQKSESFCKNGNDVLKIGLIFVLRNSIAAVAAAAAE